MSLSVRASIHSLKCACPVDHPLCHSPWVSWVCFVCVHWNIYRSRGCWQECIDVETEMDTPTWNLYQQKASQVHGSHNWSIPSRVIRQHIWTVAHRIRGNEGTIRLCDFVWSCQFHEPEATHFVWSRMFESLQATNNVSNHLHFLLTWKYCMSASLIGLSRIRSYKSLEVQSTMTYFCPSLEERKPLFASVLSRLQRVPLQSMLSEVHRFAADPISSFDIETHLRRSIEQYTGSERGVGLGKETIEQLYLVLETEKQDRIQQTSQSRRLFELNQEQLHLLNGKFRLSMLEALCRITSSSSGSADVEQRKICCPSLFHLPSLSMSQQSLQEEEDPLPPTDEEPDAVSIPPPEARRDRPPLKRRKVELAGAKPTLMVPVSSERVSTTLYDFLTCGLSLIEVNEDKKNGRMSNKHKRIALAEEFRLFEKAQTINYQHTWQTLKQRVSSFVPVEMSEQDMAKQCLEQYIPSVLCPKPRYLQGYGFYDVDAYTHSILSFRPRQLTHVHGYESCFNLFSFKHHHTFSFRLLNISPRHLEDMIDPFTLFSSTRQLYTQSDNSHLMQFLSEAKELFSSQVHP